MSLASAPSQRLPSVQTYRLLLVLVYIFPGLMGGVLLLLHVYQDGCAQLEADQVQTARSMVQAVDSAFHKEQSMALARATSDLVVQQEQERAHRRAKRPRTTEASPAVLDPQAPRQAHKTARPEGESSPSRRDLNQLHSASFARQMVVSELFAGDGEMRASVTMPVLLGDKASYFLSFSLGTRIFSEILRLQQLPEQWVASVVDRHGTIAMQSLGNETFAGKQVDAELLKRLMGPPEGAFQTLNPQGIPAWVVYSRSAQSGWSVSISVPRKVLEAQLRQRMLWLAAGATALLCLSMGLVWFLGGRLAASVLALRASALAWGQGRRSGLAQVHIREAQEVAQAMDQAERVLGERSQALSASQQALLAREAELYALQCKAKIGDWTWNLHTGASWASPALCQIFGLREMPAFAQQDGLLFAHETWLELRNARWETVDTGVGFDLELPALHANASALWLRCSGELLRDAAGERIGLRGMVQDLTERRLAEIALRQRELRDTKQRQRQASEHIALRAEMQTLRDWQVARHAVAGLAHEINQPLATVSVLCEAASRMLWADGQALTAARAERLEQTLQRVASETERAGGVVRQRMQSVRQPDSMPRPVALNELLNSAAKMALDEGASGCAIHISCPVNLKSVNANPLQMTKVLINLLNNACEAMQTAQIVKGGIWINATLLENGRMVEVSVGDEGPGIHAGMEQEIFQPFVTTKPNRLGMGLAISRALVEAHHGRLWLDEAPVGMGATFHFTLPTSG